MENTKSGWPARVAALLLAFLAAVLLSACAANFYTAADRCTSD